MVNAVIIMAAGLGKRMNSKLPKVLHPVAGKPMLAHAVSAAEAVAPEHLVVVVGHGRELVEEQLRAFAPQAVVAVQEQLLGTGDAARAGLGPLPQPDGEIVIINGDMPLLEGATVRRLVEDHRAGGNDATILIAELPDPVGYGRVLRRDGLVRRIVEERDASEAERAVSEVNVGVYVFQAQALLDSLAELRPENEQGEYYLTDTIGLIAAAGGQVGTSLIEDFRQVEGVNDRVQLAARNQELNRRILRRWMLAGVTILDPASTWIEADVSLAPDVTLLPGTSLEGATSIATGAVIGPDTTLKDTEVGEGAQIARSQATLSIIEAGAQVGPFSYLRPGTVVGADGKLGAFCETKNTKIGAGAKVPHLTYAGDAVIGEGANIGAGTIFANFDGVNKSVSTVGAHSFIGSDSVLVAPVNVAAGAYVAAGSVVTQDVGPGELGITRAEQRSVPGWVARRRPGTKTAQEADKSQDGDDGEN
ncbi:MAG: bifunctional UDP-N-acetylglucosamine diphosphorylase/glucosamine-1-phosphate N-acetyltransferase GlmU [Propionibacteriaceae bacterium]|nr:bifunctional UDP-N-acetylglucosamine diphosphorylase/glucosamine-1-phosphate N-acetyltransferase GlmU [Propionibacteriaceae bacterium]